MKSMTGYGRGERSAEGSRITVELKSVNRRQSEVVVRMPRELDSLESRIREEIQRTVARGRVEVIIVAVSEVPLVASRINRAMAASYVAELRSVAAALELASEITLELVLRCPGVIETPAETEATKDLWTAVGPALRAAQESLDEMRQREGSLLHRELDLRIAQMKQAVTLIRQQIPEAARRHREQLLARITAAGLTQVSADDERVIREVVFYADRCDISEELTRLESHFIQYEDCCQSVEPVGRKLDFLAQEMNREINTIGSKANDAVIAGEVIRLKTELERFREQVQNIE